MENWLEKRKKMVKKWENFGILNIRLQTGAKKFQKLFHLSTTNFSRLKLCLKKLLYAYTLTPY